MPLPLLVIPAKAEIQGFSLFPRTSPVAMRFAVARHPSESWDPFAVALLVIPAKAESKDFSRFPGHRPVAMRFAVARHPSESRDPFVIALLVIPAKAGIQGLFMLSRTSPGRDALRGCSSSQRKLGSILPLPLLVIPAKAGIQGLFMLYRSPVRSNSQSFRPSKAGRVTFLC